MKTMILALCALSLVACNSNSCLDKGEQGRVVDIGANDAIKTARTTISTKLQLKNGTIRVCLIDPVYMETVNNGDVLQGPITQSWEYRQR